MINPLLQQLMPSTPPPIQPHDAETEADAIVLTILQQDWARATELIRKWPRGNAHVAAFPRGNKRFSLLHHAVSSGAPPLVVEYMLHYGGFHVNESTLHEGSTPVSLCLLHQNSDVLECLLRQGAKLNVQDRFCWDPLMYAIFLRAPMDRVRLLVRSHEGGLELARYVAFAQDKDRNYRRLQPGLAAYLQALDVLRTLCIVNSVPRARGNMQSKGKAVHAFVLLPDDLVWCLGTMLFPFPPRASKVE